MTGFREFLIFLLWYYNSKKWQNCNLESKYLFVEIVILYYCFPILNPKSIRNINIKMWNNYGSDVFSFSFVGFVGGVDLVSILKRMGLIIW